ncbi:MAG TPA: BRCT domain-containing protein [Caulobacterales bacterium]|nr:BRCT domain-containing protein [Caulobacterales bacterium]
MDNELHNRYGRARISSRQIDELIGISRGLAADGVINQTEVEFLQRWLEANVAISDEPVIRKLYVRVGEILSDGLADSDERTDLLDTLLRFADPRTEPAEMLKASTLPLSDPAPLLTFEGRRYCFTGTFDYGCRTACESAVSKRGAVAGSLTQKTDFLVIGAFATESWKHSAFGNKILKACEYQSKGIPIAIVSETHWAQHL